MMGLSKLSSLESTRKHNLILVIVQCCIFFFFCTLVSNVDKEQRSTDSYRNLWMLTYGGDWEPRQMFLYTGRTIKRALVTAKFKKVTLML